MDLGSGDLATDCQEHCVEDLHSVQGFLSQMVLNDLATKAQLLQSLSSFLPCVAATISASAEDYSVFAWVGSSKVSIRREEILDLYDLLVRDLKNDLNFLSTSHMSSSSQSEPEQDDEVLSRTLHLEVVSQTLRCCIRILPLLDFFDTSVSLTAEELLEGLMQQLCSPTGLLGLLGFATPSGLNLQQNCPTESWRKSQGLEGDYECLASKVLSSAVSISNADSHATKEFGKRVDFLFAILEVYMDELLIRPDLRPRLLSFRCVTRMSSIPEHLDTSHAEAALETAFAHVLLSYVFKAATANCTSSADNSKLLLCNLSLPGSLLLLEMFTGLEIPRGYLTHISRLVARVLNDTATLALDEPGNLRPEIRASRRSCWAGGVDWSYCTSEGLLKCDARRRLFGREVLPCGATLQFVSSIFEHALQLYVRSSSYLELFPSGEESDGADVIQNGESSFAKRCLSKYKPLLDHFMKHLEPDQADSLTHVKESTRCPMGCNAVDHSRDSEAFSAYSDSHLGAEGCQFGLHSGSAQFDASGGVIEPQMPYSEKSSITPNCHSAPTRADSNEASILLPALLQLMTRALECIRQEISKLSIRADKIIGHSANGHVEARSDIDIYPDSFLDSVSVCFTSYLPTDGRLLLKYCKQQSARMLQNKFQARMVTYGVKPLINSVGDAVLFFTDALCCEVRKGASEEILKDYFQLLETLVALLLIVDGRNNSLNCTSRLSSDDHGLSSEKVQREGFSCSPHGKCHANEDGVQLQHEDFLSIYLEAMVSLLQGLVQDLSTEQKPLPQFLLVFILQQVSRGDGLNLVAMAFTSPYKNQLHLHQKILSNAKLFRSGLLFDQLVQLASSQPARVSSLLTFTVYMTNILEDLLPITETLPLPEGAESLSWFENIASSFILAWQFAVSEERAIDRSIQELLVTKMFEGIGRLFNEGVAVSRWLSQCYRKGPVEISNMGSIREPCEDVKNYPTGEVRGIAWNQMTQLAMCKSFLIRVESLRRGVDTLRNNTERILVSKFSCVFVKAQSFLEAYSEVDAFLELSRCHLSYRSSSQYQTRLPEHGSQDSVNSGQSSQEQTRVPDHNPRHSLPSIDVVKSLFKDDQLREPQNDGIKQGFTTAENHKLDHEDGICEKPKGVERNTALCPTSTAPDEITLGPSAEDYNLHQDGERNTLDSEQENLPRCERASTNRVESGVTRKLVTGSSPAAEKRVTRSATCLMAKNLTGMVNAGSDLPISPTTPEKKLSCSRSTMSIIKRLMERHQPVRTKQSKDIENRGRFTQVEETSLFQGRAEGGSAQENSDVGSPVSTNITNPYVDFVLSKDEIQEKFEDLSDFIVCKKGKNYPLWLKRRRKVRQRLHTRNLWKRLEAKRDLMTLLDVLE